MSTLNSFSFKSANNQCYGTVNKDTLRNVIVITGKCLVLGTNTIRYIAAAPADVHESHFGSYLPFANPEMAYEETVNKGEIILDKSKNFTIKISIPNSYYVRNGTHLISPHIHLTIGKEYFNIPLGEPVENKSLTSLKDKPTRVTMR